MSRIAPPLTAALAAVLIMAGSFGAVITVPPAHASVPVAAATLA